MRDILYLDIQESSAVGEIRRHACALARSLGFSEIQIGQVAIVVTELGTNLLKHAGGGEILARSLECHGIRGIEIVAVDSGPGMEDIAHCRKDGVSTVHTAGTGLGAVERLAHMMDIVSWPGRGTAVMARLWQQEVPSCPKRPFLVGAVCLPMHPDEPCGDAWAVEQEGGRAVVLVVDGLGHGLDAAQAAHAALDVFAEHWRRSPAEVMARLHGGLRVTRGAAALVVELNRGSGQARACGMGNIFGRIIGATGERTIVSWPGIVGFQAPRLREEVLPMGPDDVVVLASDGIRTHMDLDAYPGIWQHHPSLAAAILFRDFSRRRDDTTVVVLQPEKLCGEAAWNQ
jgi:anti-sigma regulatory factor (Ser/Thr protein kinase)